MLFNSYIFIFLFFPICLAGYYGMLRIKKKEPAQLFLILMSFWFYGYFQLNYLLIMIFSIGMNYIFHRLISRKPSKPLLAAAITLNLGILFYFKYCDFFISNINAVFGTSFLLRHILLPLGISFFTFQQIGFIVDTYNGEIKDCPLPAYTLFVAFFPQLIAGPIVNQAEMLPQFDNMTEKKFDCELFYKGIVLFILGLFKKVILADTFGAGVEFGYSEIEILGRMDAVLVIISYSLQLYFDFSGYCDMARGIGAMLGIDIPVNFNSPYRAVNIVDFWKRWHITLNRFFTKYVYIPLGGNRRGDARMYINYLIVFFLSGLWHGAGWNFIVWGMMHGSLYVITKYWQKRRNGNVRRQNVIMTLVSKICLFAYVSIAWVYFRAEDIAQANKMLLTAIFGKWQKLSFELAECFRLDEFWYVLKLLRLDGMAYSRYVLMFFMLVVGMLLSMAAPDAAGIAKRAKGKAVPAVLLGGIFVWCILTFSNVSTFLYFNF